MYYKLTNVAEQDLIEIADYIALDNRNAAYDLMKKLKKTFDKLTLNPKIGHKRTDLTSKDVLFWSVKNYLIVYKIQKDYISIIRVLSAYRDITSLL